MYSRLEDATVIRLTIARTSGVLRIFFGFFKSSIEDREQREGESGGRSSLVRGSGSSCNLVQDISFHIVKFS